MKLASSRNISVNFFFVEQDIIEIVGLLVIVDLSSSPGRLEEVTTRSKKEGFIDMCVGIPLFTNLACFADSGRMDHPYHVAHLDHQKPHGQNGPNGPPGLL